MVKLRIFFVSNRKRNTRWKRRLQFMVELEPILWKLNPESNQRSSNSVSNGRGQCPSGAKSIRCWTLPTVKFVHFFGNKSLRKLLQRTRTQFIQPYRSKNVLIEGVTVVNSPMWIVHPVLCENVIVRNVNLTRFAYDLSPIHSFCLFQKIVFQLRTKQRWRRSRIMHRRLDHWSSIFFR